MQFLITGIGGFVGQHLARHLMEQGHEVIGMTHKSVTGTDDPADRFNLISGDLTDKHEIDDVFTSWRFDGVFHLGSRTHPPTSFQEPVSYFETNALGAVYLTEAIRKHQPETVLMNCSTCEVYGIHPEGTYISEKTPTLASNPYSVSKLAADIYIQERCANGLLKAFITRGFSHTGPGRPSNYSISSDAIQIAKIIKGKQEPIIKVGNLSCKRVVMDVRDVVAIYAQLMSKYLHYPEGILREDGDIEYGEVFNIGGDDLHDIGYYLQLMLDIFNVDAKTEVDDRLYRKFDIPVQYPDSSKVRNLLGWNPKYDIKETLTDLVNYWLERV
jgi:GDP-4-dehydro-6-deoxy-D-mannose reductase